MWIRNMSCRVYVLRPAPQGSVALLGENPAACLPFPSLPLGELLSFWVTGSGRSEPQGPGVWLPPCCSFTGGKRCLKGVLGHPGRQSIPSQASLAISEVGFPGVPVPPHCHQSC